MSCHRSRWSRLLGLPPEQPRTRLTEAQALALAAASAQVAALGRALPVATAHRDDAGRVVWLVGSGDVGARWRVEVDDADGTVGPVRHAATR